MLKRATLGVSGDISRARDCTDRAEVTTEDPHITSPPATPRYCNILYTSKQKRKRGLDALEFELKLFRGRNVHSALDNE